MQLTKLAVSVCVCAVRLMMRHSQQGLHCIPCPSDGDLLDVFVASDEPAMEVNGGKGACKKDQRMKNSDGSGLPSDGVGGSVEEYDPWTAWLYKPRTISVLLVGACLLIWASGALDPEGATSHNTMTSIKTGVWAMIAVFLAYCTLQAPSTILIRPHPAVWRLVHGMAVVYLIALTFLLFQNRDDARQFMKHLHPGLGVELPERSYGYDCRLYVPENPKNKFINVHETLFDEFVIAHVLGWWGKAVMIRNQLILWVLSIGFELMELTFRHMLPNFNECWWDSIILDILVCNWFGEISAFQDSILRHPSGYICNVSVVKNKSIKSYFHLYYFIDVSFLYPLLSAVSRTQDSMLNLMMSTNCQCKTLVAHITSYSHCYVDVSHTISCLDLLGLIRKVRNRHTFFWKNQLQNKSFMIFVLSIIKYYYCQRNNRCSLIWCMNIICFILCFMQMLPLNWYSDSGIWAGMHTVRYFDGKTYEWVGLSRQPSIMGKVKRSLCQFTPAKWDKDQWRPFMGPWRFIQVLCLCIAFMTVELNTFFLKFCLWIPPRNPLVVYRLILWWLIAIPTIREYNSYLQDSKPVKKVGAFCWLSLAICILELLICMKFGHGLFHDPMPTWLIICWSSVGISLVLFLLAWSWRDHIAFWRKQL